ncbi:MAG: GNAT family N-acetyltransferase [Candidatus Hodarchaeota archaeon]
MTEVVSYQNYSLQEFNDLNSSILIRKADILDLDQLRDLWIEQRNYHYELDSLYAYTEESPQKWVEQIENILHSESQRVYVAVNSQGHILGYIHGGIYPWPISPYEYYGSLNTVSVTREAQGQGIGKRLIMKLLDWFKDKGIEQVSLHVDYRNHRALKLYHSLGFRPYQHRLMLSL